MKEATAHGFDHYEISNFGLPGYHSKHNSNYWKNKKYMGIGPSAHSYNSTSRQWNISANASYILSIKNKQVPAEVEVLSLNDRFNEYIMTGLRTKWGLNKLFIEQEFGSDLHTFFIGQIEKYITSGEAILKDEIIVLSDEGKCIADRIASECFKVSDTN